MRTNTVGNLHRVFPPPRFRDHAKVFMPLVFGFMLLLALSVGADPAKANELPNGELPKTATAKEIANKWSKTSREEVLKAANAGSAEAQFYYAKLEWEAASQDSGRSSQWYMEHFMQAPVVSDEEGEKIRAQWKDAATAKLRQAAESGDYRAGWYLTEVEFEQATARQRVAIDWIRKAAEQSLPAAEAELASHYLGLEWVIIPTDEGEGMKWLERAVSHDFEWAQHKLADLLLSGRFGEPDLVRALDLLRIAADKNCWFAQFELAMLYANGNGEPRNEGDTPIALLRTSSQGNNAYAQVELAGRYQSGLGVQKNLVRAARQYVLAANHEDLNYRLQARVDRVMELLTPDSAPKPTSDPETLRFANALAIQSRAIRLEDPSAMMKMVELELSSANDDRARVFAYGWLSRASELGLAAAGVERDRLQKEMSETELQTARKILSAHRGEQKRK